MPKLTNEAALKVDGADLEKAVMKQMQELEQALQQELQKSGRRKKSKRPKRAGEPLSDKKVEKMSKLTDEETTEANVAKIERASASQIEELERALDENVDQSRVLQLAGEIAKTPDLPSNLTMRLLNYCAKAIYGSEDVACQLLANQSVDLETPEASELLWQAVDEGQARVATLLVRHGVDLSVRRDGDKHTILHAVLRSNSMQFYDKSRELLRLLLDSGADVNARDSVGRSVLHYAIRSYYCTPELIEELLSHGARLTTGEDDRSNDLVLACKAQPELLPRLIEHRVPDVETRNQRGITAIECLIREGYTGVDLAGAMKVVKKILDLGVPVDVPDSQREKRKFSFLHMALWYKKKAAIKLLLDCGANPHQTNVWGRTTLYQATTFRGYTHACRWLIERGVSVHARNEDGGYPIHGACENESERNIHLFLNLGADLNATDDKGRTPFNLLLAKKSHSGVDAQHLVIKHLALIEAQGGKINDADTAAISQCAGYRNHFNECTRQIDLMKEEKVYGDVSYFSLLSKNVYSTVQLMKNKNFLYCFKWYEKRRAESFPQYFHMLSHSVEIAEKRLRVLLAKKRKLHDVFLNVMPEHIVERIAYYLHFEKLQRCQHDFYMSFHATLKYTEADKAKIL